MKIIIDNGHGENTPGKRSPIWSDGAQLFEWEFNRDIANRLYHALKQRNIDIELLVREHIDVPLRERVRRANDIAIACGPQNCLLVSIHANAGGGTGWEAWTSIGKTKSDDYVAIFYDQAHIDFPSWRIREDWTNGNPGKEDNYTILKSTLCPAIITENFFMDTEKDCRYIMSPEGRTAVANFHVNAILRCIELSSS